MTGHGHDGAKDLVLLAGIPVSIRDQLENHSLTTDDDEHA
jgi:hypothetical protein